MCGYPHLYGECLNKYMYTTYGLYNMQIWLTCTQTNLL